MTNHSNIRPTVPFAKATAAHGAGGNEADESYQVALTIAEAADDRKAGDITILKVSDVSYLADYFVVMTGFSSVQVRAIARSVEDKVEEVWHRLPRQVEGKGEGRWVLLDYGDVIVHIFLPDEREFYNLEAFWGHSEQIPFTPSQATPIGRQ